MHVAKCVLDTIPISQIRFADLAYSHHPCLSLCVTFYVNVGFQVAKYLKKNLYASPVFYFLNLTFIFKIKIW